MAAIDYPPRLPMACRTGSVVAAINDPGAVMAAITFPPGSVRSRSRSISIKWDGLFVPWSKYLFFIPRMA